MPLKPSEQISRYIAAIGALLARNFPPDMIPNSRRVIFIWAEDGEENNFEQLARDGDHDIVCLLFKPNREADGPSKIAVYEERDGTVHAWTNCVPCLPVGEDFFFIASKDHDTGFTYNGNSLLPVHGVPHSMVVKGMKPAREWLRRCARRAPDELLSQMPGYPWTG